MTQKEDNTIKHLWQIDYDEEPDYEGEYGETVFAEEKDFVEDDFEEESFEELEEDEDEIEEEEL